MSRPCVLPRAAVVKLRQAPRDRAATPVRAHQTEAALLGQAWSADTVMAAVATLRAEFQPITDMRASAAYRQTVLGNLLQRFWLESQGLQAINLESVSMEALA
eukprot:gene19707-biopygen12811